MPPDYTEYTTVVNLYNKGLDDIAPDVNKEVVIVQVNLDIWDSKIKDGDLWRSLSDDDWMRELIDFTYYMPVKNISFQRTRIWPTRK